MRFGAVSGLVVVVLAVVTGASAGRSLSAMTLQLRDLPTGYTQSKSFACSPSCMKKTQGSVPAGYVNGWERDYYAGLKQVASRATQYTTNASASRSVRSAWANAERHGCKRVSLVEKIGDEARMDLCKENGVSVYAVTWRSGKFRGAILLSAYVVGGKEAAALGVKQQTRMK
ncbi:MAG: hypothetical protein ACXVY6_11600 [Gaiellaceae bacterium]